MSRTDPPPDPRSFDSIRELETREVRPGWLEVRIRVVEERTMKGVVALAERLEALADQRIQLLRRDGVFEVGPEGFREPHLWRTVIAAARRDEFAEAEQALAAIEANCAGCHERLAVSPLAIAPP